MPRFSANLMFLFQEYDFLDRIDAAARVGFTGVEHQFPYDTPVQEIINRLDSTNLEMVLINAPAGDYQAGERGLAALPDRKQSFRDSLEDALEYAVGLGCPRIHVMAGIIDEESDKESAMAVYEENLSFAADLFATQDIRLLIEALNPRDVPGYLLGHSHQARAVMASINHPNIYLQYDLYHAAMNGENLIEGVSLNLEVIDHMQVAGTPGRHEPNVGDVDFSLVFEAIDMMGYTDWIGCEYAPQTTTESGLGWASVYGIQTD